jgi:glycosyltransferase involved in cell wall biosynthesis/GT2 family glycosyltransferase
MTSLNPRLVHLLPWDLTVGGAQRMLDLWCTHEASRWDTHIISLGERGPFAFTGATVHSNLKREQTLELIGSLEPDLLVHHEPAERNGIVSKCPQVWVAHCTSTLRELAPQHAKPVTVFSNFDSHEIHSSWRELSLKVLPLQVDPHQFYPTTESNHDGLVCGIVGRLHEDKVPRSFIKALLEWEPGPWRIRFVGHGLGMGYQEFVKAQLGNLPWVEFSGDVDPNEMPASLRQLDAVLIPTDLTHGETGSYSALEAMATGLPVIARDLHGIRFNCGDVLLYAIDDPDILARLRELDHAEVRFEAGDKARKSVVNKYAAGKHVVAHSTAFSEALSCKVSILMPVFDTPASYLSKCWESIRAQTFREWELVLVDDGSSNVETLEEIERIAVDPRVNLIRLDENEGIATALNVGLSRCRSDLVARMDADDIMMPTRLARQFEYLQAHPDVTIVGTQMQAIEWQTDRLLAPRTHPEEVTNEFIQHQQDTSEIWFLNHPTVMLRRREIMNLGGYPMYRVAQDLGLWLRVVKAGLKIHNLPTVELYYRLHPNQTSTARGVRLEEYAAIVAECWTQQTSM